MQKIILYYWKKNPQVPSSEISYLEPGRKIRHVVALVALVPLVPVPLVGGEGGGGGEAAAAHRALVGQALRRRGIVKFEK